MVTVDPNHKRCHSVTPESNSQGGWRPSEAWQFPAGPPVSHSEQRGERLAKQRRQPLAIPRLAEACRFCDGTGHPIDALALGLMLRTLRGQRNVSLREIARRLEKSATYVLGVETAEKKVGRVRVAFVRDYLKALEA
jgi:hypothetical protein